MDGVFYWLTAENYSFRDLRSWIDEENIKFHEKEKESEAKAPIPKMKVYPVVTFLIYFVLFYILSVGWIQILVQDLNQKMNAKVAKVMLCLKERSLVSVSEHDNVISETESKTKRLHSEVTENILNKSMFLIILQSVSTYCKQYCWWIPE